MHKAIASILLAAALAGFMAQPDAVAQEQTIYKWVDAEGVVHYDARPPADGDFVELDINTREPVDPAEDRGEAADETPPSEQEQPPAEQAASEPAGPDPELVAERCKQARDNMEKLNQRNNLLVRDDDGEPHVISSEERQQMLDEAQKFVDEWC